MIENILTLIPDCPMAISDQFANPELLRRSLGERGKKIDLRQRHKAEADIAVAAASILARERFINWLDQTGERAGTTLPKGASDAVIQAGIEITNRHGKDVLHKVAKLHFKTTNEILANSDS